MKKRRWFDRLPKRKWTVTLILDTPGAEEFDVEITGAPDAVKAEARAILAVSWKLKVDPRDIIHISTTEVK